MPLYSENFCWYLSIPRGQTSIGPLLVKVFSFLAFLDFRCILVLSNCCLATQQTNKHSHPTTTPPPSPAYQSLALDQEKSALGDHFCRMTEAGHSNWLEETSYFCPSFPAVICSVVLQWSKSTCGVTVFFSELGFALYKSEKCELRKKKSGRLHWGEWAGRTFSIQRKADLKWEVVHNIKEHFVSSYSKIYYYLFGLNLYESFDKYIAWQYSVLWMWK